VKLCHPSAELNADKNRGDKAESELMRAHFERQKIATARANAEDSSCWRSTVLILDASPCLESEVSTTVPRDRTLQHPVQ
jgi:hypothetical protein